MKTVLLITVLSIVASAQTISAEQLAAQEQRSQEARLARDNGAKKANQKAAEAEPEGTQKAQITDRLAANYLALESAFHAANARKLELEITLREATKSLEAECEKGNASLAKQNGIPVCVAKTQTVKEAGK